MRAEAVSEEAVDCIEERIVESLRFPGEGSSAQGKSGPKSRPKGVDDGQQVENPVPPEVA